MSLRASTMSGARSSIMLVARNAGLTMLSAFAAASWTSMSVTIHISLQTTDGYHFRSTPINRQFQTPSALRKSAKIGSQQTSFNHLAGLGGQQLRHFEAERFGGSQVDHQFELGWCLHRKVAGLVPL